MKQLITILILFLLSFNLKAQNDNILISRTDKLLYVGFDNLLVVGFKDSVITTLKVQCEGCERDIIKEQRGYIIPVTKVGRIQLSFFDGDRLLQTSVFEAVLPPQPDILIDDSVSIELMNSMGSFFSLKMPNYTEISPQYHIAEWTIVIGKKTFTGKGNNITPELNKYIAKLKKPTPAKISIGFTFGKKQTVEREFILNN